MKQRLDPKCWTGKKIGNPATKIKGGVRVNNCVPAESVEEDNYVRTAGPNPTRIPGNMAAPQWNEPAWSFQEIAEKLGIPTGALNLLAFQTIGGFPEAISGVAAKHGSKKYYKRSEVKRWVNANQVREKLAAIKAKKGMAEEKNNPPKSAEDQQRKYAQDTAAMAQGELVNKMPRVAPTTQRKDPKMGMQEEYNAEYDDEAGMADNNLGTLRRAVEGLDDLIDAGDNLPEWCQEKIAVAKSMLVAVWDYMESADDAEEEDPEIAEMYEAMEQLVSEMARRNRVNSERVWEQFEALPDNVLYETAAWRRKEGKSKTGGLNAKGVASYRRENPGSKLQTAVTTKPSKLKPGSKAAKRRKSFCARMSGVKGPMKKPNGKPTRKALALRKWNC